MLGDERPDAQAQRGRWEATGARHCAPATESTLREWVGQQGGKGRAGVRLGLGARRHSDRSISSSAPRIRPRGELRRSLSFRAQLFHTPARYIFCRRHAERNRTCHFVQIWCSHLLDIAGRLRGRRSRPSGVRYLRKAFEKNRIPLRHGRSVIFSDCSYLSTYSQAEMQ